MPTGPSVGEPRRPWAAGQERPKYLRWALIEAATHAARDAHYRERYERTKQRLGRQRGAKVARIDIARKLAEAIWHILTKNEPFVPRAPLCFWSLDDPLWNWGAGAASHQTLSFSQKAIEKRALLDRRNSPRVPDARLGAVTDQRVVTLTVGPSS